MRPNLWAETSGTVRLTAREQRLVRVFGDLSCVLVEALDGHLRQRGQPVAFPVKLWDARPVPGHRFGAMLRTRGGERLTLECVVEGSRSRPSRASVVAYRVFPSLIASTAI